MGIEYTLANHKDKTAFELGKGSWYNLLVDGGAYLLFEYLIYDVIVNDIWDHLIDDKTEDVKFWEDYAKELSGKIFKFINDADPSQISLCNDSDDSNFELREKQYRWVGSRYKSFNSEEYNKHLKVKK